MEIKDFNELNAINKLLWKVKFNDDLDFSEIRDICGSPFIADVFKRINEDFRLQAIERGIIDESNILEFKLENHFGKTIKNRIQSLSESERNNLSKLDSSSFKSYLRNLIIPLKFSSLEFDKLEKYALEVINEK